MVQINENHSLRKPKNELNSHNVVWQEWNSAEYVHDDVTELQQGRKHPPEHLLKNENNQPNVKVKT